MPKPEHKNNSSVNRRFSAAADTYHQLAKIQRRVAEQLMKLLPPARTPSRILEIGCGTGILTAMLADAFPSAMIDAVDISSAMSARARENLSGNKKIKWIVADIRDLSGRKKYPLIVSNCALHWINPIEPVISKLGSMLEREGQLAFSIMVHDTLAELNAARSRVTPHKPGRVILPGKSEVRGAVSKSGLAIVSEKSGSCRYESSSAAALLRQLHDQGLTGGNSPSGNKLLTRGEIKHLLADYTRHYRNTNGVYASYRFFSCLARKEM